MDDMSQIKTLLMLPKHGQNFYGNDDQSIAANQNESGNLPGQVDAEVSQDMNDSSATTNEQRTFLGSIGNFIWGSKDSSNGSYGIVDAQLQEQMGTITVDDLLKKENAWIRIIEISRNLWGKQLPDALIKQFLNEYDEMQLARQTQQNEQDAKFNDSNGQISEDDVVLQRESSPTKKLQIRETAQKQLSEQSQPHEGSLSSEDLNDVNLEQPNNESPMQQDGGNKMPKKTKLMFSNVEEMRKGSQQSPREMISGRSRLNESQPFRKGAGESMSSQIQGRISPRAHKELLAKKKEHLIWTEQRSMDNQSQSMFARQSEQMSYNNYNSRHQNNNSNINNEDSNSNLQISGFDVQRKSSQQEAFQAASKALSQNSIVEKSSAKEKRHHTHLQQIQKLHYLQQHQAQQAKRQIEVLERQRIVQQQIQRQQQSQSSNFQGKAPTPFAKQQ